MKVDIFNTDKKYIVIYADPPWQFSTWSNKAQKHVTKHYQTMTKEDIESLPISQIADDNAVLFLWVTYPNLEQGLNLIKTWGFMYKTCGFFMGKVKQKEQYGFCWYGLLHEVK